MSLINAGQASTNITVNPVSSPVKEGPVLIHTRFFAQIPDYGGRPSRIVGIVSQNSNLYVTTSSSGGFIYKVNPNGSVRLWFNVARAIFQKTGRKLSIYNRQHGGLRGLAFHPQFNRNGLFYVSAIETRPRNPRAVRYLSRVAKPQLPSNVDSVVIEFKYGHKLKRVIQRSYRQVIRIELPESDHPIKQIAFQGPFLLIGHGDASVQSAYTGGGQNNDALGKIIRINPLRRGNLPYTVPGNNPFVKNRKYLPELFAVGFRNPHNICVSKRHGIFVTDAGRDNVEEVNIVKPGRNYGWSQREGTFVHLRQGGTGLGVGVRHIPRNDQRFKYTYPNVQFGHKAKQGDKYVGIALAGACPVENGSPLSGLFIYANFPTDGAVYYSKIEAMKNSRVTGPPGKLTQAKTFRAKVLFDHDRNGQTNPVLLDNLREVIRRDGKRTPNAPRVDLRFGRGPQGELYWSSKTNGRIYLITNSKRRKKERATQEKDPWEEWNVF